MISNSDQLFILTWVVHLVRFREWSLFLAGGGGKGGDIEFECKQLERGKIFEEGGMF